MPEAWTRRAAARRETLSSALCDDRCAQKLVLIDVALGVIEEGTWNVADAVKEQPWLPNGPIPLNVTWTRGAKLGHGANA